MYRYWKLARKELLLACLLPLVAGIGIGAPGWLGYQRSAAFVENLRAAEGRVMGFLSTPDGRSVEVAYVNEAGLPFRRQFAVDAGRAQELRAIGKVSLVYDVRNPADSALGDIVSANQEKLLFAALAGAGALLLLGGLFTFGRHAARIVRIRSLFRNGRLVQTQVRDCSIAPHKRAGRFTYAFRGPNGRWFEGRSPELPAEALAEWPVGRPIIAAYDEKDPRRTEVDLFHLAEALRESSGQPQLKG
jgi:hypothetical protein